jgi:cytochrome c-type biogenesis protein CcmH/NrfG
LSLGAAFAGIILLFLLVFWVYFCWQEFFTAKIGKTTVQSSTLEESPEWHALQQRRQEIEQDPMLDPVSKNMLIENWKVMAAEVRPLMASSAAASTNNWFGSKSLPVLVIALLSLALVFTYSIGGVHQGALKWPGASSASISAKTDTPQPGTSSGHPGDGTNLQERVAGLESRLKNNPEDINGWVLLARTQASLSKYEKSAAALQAALVLAPGHPDILADLADMTAMARGRQLAGEPMQYVQQALEGDPMHEKALALAASGAEQAGDQATAQAYWQRLSQVQQAKLMNEGAPASQATPEPVANVVATVSVQVTQSQRDALNPDSALFVFMKDQPSPGMPLAVVRVPASMLVVGQQTVRLGPGDFLQEGGHENLPDTLYFQARLSVQGMAQTGAGDLTSSWVKLSQSSLAQGVALEFKQ